MKIKVTGYISEEDLEPEEIDLDHETGLSSEGFGAYTDMLDMLSDVTFKKVD